MADSTDLTFTNNKIYTKHKLEVKNVVTAAELFGTTTGSENILTDRCYVLAHDDESESE